MGSSEQTRQNILTAAEQEFSQKGLYGARIDEIAALSGANKRMIYAYFINKEGLYRAVLTEVYSRRFQIEAHCLKDGVCCADAITSIIREYFSFLRDNPTFVNLIMWENLNQGKYIEEEQLSGIAHTGLEDARLILLRGIDGGEFRRDIDIDQTLFSLNMFCFSYFSNRYTMAKLMGARIDDDNQITNAIKTVTEMFLHYLCV